MKLPIALRARIDCEKLQGYLLDASHEEGGSKAHFYAEFGFTVDRWVELGDALRLIAQSCDVGTVVQSQHGVKYVVDGALQSPDGRCPYVRTVWIFDNLESGLLSETPRLVTAYPRRGDEE